MNPSSTPDPSAELVRVSVELGPWPSPDAPGWQRSYDELLEGIAADGRSAYLVLEPALAPTPLDGALAAGGDESEAESWLAGYVDHAQRVILRYAGVAAAFEVLPQPETTAERGPIVSPEWMARALTMLDKASRGPVFLGRDLEGEELDEALFGMAKALAQGGAPLVPCVPAGPQGGAGYLEALYAAGRDHHGWADGGAPVGGVSVRLVLDLAAPPSPQEASRDLAALRGALDRLDPDEDAPTPVFVSGFVLAGGARDVHDPLVVDTAVAAAVRAVTDDPHARLAVLGTADMGPGAIPEIGDPARNEGVVELAPTWALFASASDAPSRSGPPAEPPKVDGFDFPCWKDVADPWRDYKIDADLCDPGYFTLFKGVWHPGEDWNGKGGGNTDLGDPVYAIAHGLVTTAAYFPSSWGNVVLVRHDLPDGSSVWSQYAHLDAMHVGPGEVVLRGQQVGTLGKGAPKAGMLAHLHFEIRLTDLRADNWSPMVRDKAQVLANYAVPKEFIAARRPGQLPAADAVSVVVDEKDAGFRKADVPHWMAAGAGHGGGAWYTFGSRSTEANVGTWTAALPEPGSYQVAAFVPRVHATTRNAVYTISHGAGSSTARIDQSKYHDQWVPLGVFAFGAGSRGEVRLSDKTGEAEGLKREVAFDAVRWLKVG